MICHCFHLIQQETGSLGMGHRRPILALEVLWEKEHQQCLGRFQDARKDKPRIVSCCGSIGRALVYGGGYRNNKWLGQGPCCEVTGSSMPAAGGRPMPQTCILDLLSELCQLEDCFHVCPIEVKGA